MGIKGLTKLIADNAPDAGKEHAKLDAYFEGRKIAFDASMALYQFLIAMRGAVEAGVLTNAAGEATTHLQGMWARTLKFVDLGIKPVYVFDGKPPDLKSGQLAKRKQLRADAEAALAKATEEGDAEEMERFNKRTVRVTRQQNEDCMKLLRLMGMPVVQAPCEAEAQCAVLAKAGKVYAVATEDMDALTFGTPILLRHMTFSESRKMPIVEFDLAKILEGFGVSMPEFIDMCILCGCDYTDGIRGIGAKRAFELIAKHRSIPAVLAAIDKTKNVPHEGFEEVYKEAALFFKEPEVTPASEVDIKWTAPDEEGLIKFLCTENGFAEERVKKGIARLNKARKSVPQGRLESFFGPPIPQTGEKKRKIPEKKGKGKGKGKGRGLNRV
eukprot:TRINITY_DN2964_c0_g1_i1.p1 TRINITY_DN2964_c0_g1~~TRINITY_DN2964_c0_g1_i1.p1  ORF type:complete len:399 (-),score=82.33 TRINITY_DN2964_c0_g1_i1:160-1311(-)